MSMVDVQLLMNNNLQFILILSGPKIQEKLKMTHENKY